MSNDKKQIPDIVLERYVLGELEPLEMQEIEKAVQEDESLRLKIDALKKSDKEILTLYPPEQISDAIDRKMRSRNLQKKYRPITPGLVFGFSGLAAVILVFFLVTPLLIIDNRSGKTPEFQETVRAKGETRPDTPSLTIFRKQGDHAERLHNHSTTRNHDTLQVSYNAMGQKYGVIFSVDGRGSVTLHYPASRAASPELESGKVFLEDSFELDDAPYFECFFFITSNKYFDVREILEKAETMVRDNEFNREKKMDLPPGFTQNTLLLLKENE